MVIGRQYIAANKVTELLLVQHGADFSQTMKYISKQKYAFDLLTNSGLILPYIRDYNENK
jgi:hypothetical protein